MVSNRTGQMIYMVWRVGSAYDDDEVGMGMGMGNGWGRERQLGSWTGWLLFVDNL
jgi:hypothetical protein